MFSDELWLRYFSMKEVAQPTRAILCLPFFHGVEAILTHMDVLSHSF